MNRITSGSSTASSGALSWGEYYGIDAWGNLMISPMSGKAHGGNLQLAGSVNNQASGLGYDAAGNLTNYTAPGQYVYDPENRTQSTAGVTYTYDADGNRVEKSGGSVSTLYWYGAPGIIAESDLSGTLKSEYVFFNGKRLARIDLPAGTVHYYLSDHLNSTSMVVSGAGVVEDESDYSPYGTEYQITSGANHYKFTGKERDTESGLDYFGARYYSNGLGRFITPDWAEKAVDVPYAEFSDPQSLNLYSYVRNIPTVNVDADGHDGTAAAVWELLSGGLGISGPAWTAGSVALPGLLGGGLGYAAINSIAQDNYTKSNAQMQEVVASNNLAMAQQAALSQDAQAGALIKAGKDANDAASATINAATEGKAAGKYKDPVDVQEHIDKLNKGMQDVAKATQALKNAVGQKARDAAKKALEKATKEVKGHEKDLRTKPPNPKSKKGEGS